MQNGKFLFGDTDSDLIDKALFVVNDLPVATRMSVIYFPESDVPLIRFIRRAGVNMRLEAGGVR